MDASHALLAGLVAGLAIATQFGAISLLLVETALVAGPRVGVAAGMGVATADFCFAVVAALAGGAAGAALSGHEAEIHAVAAAVLATIAVRGLLEAFREPRAGGDGTTADRSRPARAQYVRLLGLTAINPLTIASFAAIAASLSLHGVTPYLAFVIGVGLASAGWHAFLTLSAAQAGRWATPTVQRSLAIAGRVAILAIALRLALAV